MSDLASAPSGPRRRTRRRPADTRPSPQPETAARAAPAAGPERRTPTPGRRPRDRPPSRRRPTGTLLAGRYRLRTRVGSDTAAGAEFWRAEDTVLRRDVAITVLRRLAADGGADRRRRRTRPGPPGPARWWCGRCARAASSTRLRPAAGRAGPRAAPGCRTTCWAPRSPSGCPAAAWPSWSPTGMISPLAAARAVAPLAAAAEAAHRHGLVLGLRPPAADPDHPGRARAAGLRAAPPERDAGRRRARSGRDPVHAAHLALAAVARRRGARRAGRAEPHAPGGSCPRRGMRPGVPIELDTLVQGTLGPSDELGPRAHRGRGAPAARRGLAEDDRIALFPPAHDGVPSSPGRRLAGREPTAAARATRSAGATWPSGWPRSALAVLIVLGYLGDPAHRGVLRRRPAGHRGPAAAPDAPSGPGNVAPPEPMTPDRPAGGVAGRPWPPASRSTTAAATATTPGGCPG